MTERRCTCSACWPDYRFFRVCRECGNKRCPKAKSHENECTNSNDPGQIGSNYEDAPKRTTATGNKEGVDE